jgi:hypothetical protein
VLATAVLVACVSPAFAQSSAPRRGPLVSARVVRLDALPRVTPHPDGPPLEVPEGEVPMGDEAMRELKQRPAPDVRTLPRVTMASPTGAVPLAASAPTAGAGYEGISQGRYIPGEPTVAVGPLNVFSPGNTSVTVANRDGSNRVEVDGSVFFGVPAAENNINDAVCFFDAVRGRFVALTFTHGNSGGTLWSWFYLAVSQTADARGAWYVYKFDQKLDGSTTTANWSDFEGLGISDDKLVMSSQQYTAAGQYRYQKLRVIDRAAAYSGGAVPYVDIVNFAAPAGGSVSNLFVTKPGRNQGASDATIHLFTVRYDGGSNVAYRTITGPATAPVLSAGSLISVSSYTPPPDAAQNDTTLLVPTGDCRTPEFTVRDGILTIAWHTGVRVSGTDYSAIRLFRMRTSDRSVLMDETYVANGAFMYYPAAIADSAGTVFVGYDRSSSTEYPSVWATGRRRSSSALQPGVLLRTGVAPYLQPRWGDYTGIDLDTFASGPAGATAWYAGQWAYGWSYFKTWVTPLTFTYGRVAGTVLEDCDGAAATTGDRSPLAGVIVSLRQGTTVVATTPSDATGAWSFGYLESGTYDVQVSAPAGGATVDAVTGTGASSQTRMTAGDIQIALTDAQLASGASFVVATSHASPATSAIAPATRMPGDSSFVLTVTGSGFLPCSVVRFDDADRPTTWSSTTELTAAIPASDVALAGPHVVTVFTPAPGGGSSAAETLMVAGGPTGVGDVARLAFAIGPIQPNPTRGTARIAFTLPAAAHVRLAILDVQGREVARLVDEDRPAGAQVATWDGRRRSGRAAAGLYFVRLDSSVGTRVARLTLTR